MTKQEIMEIVKNAGGKDVYFDCILSYCSTLTTLHYLKVKEHSVMFEKNGYLYSVPFENVLKKTEKSEKEIKEEFELAYQFACAFSKD